MKKYTRSTLVIAGLLSVSALPVSAVTAYSTDFESSTPGALHGQGGWSGTAGLTSVLPSIDGWDGQLAAIGEATSAGTASASHSATGTILDPALGPFGAGSYFEAEFAVVAASGTDSFSFGFDFNSDFLTLELIPNGTSLDVSWTSSAGTTAGGVTIPYASLTTLSVLFAPSGANDVLFTAEFAGLNTVGFNGVLPGLATDSWQGFNVGYEASNGGDSLGFDNIALHNVALVPEPGTLTLAGLALSGLMLRRRRG